jgi:hypothetical protein
MFHKQEFENNVKANPELAKEEIRRKIQDEPEGYLIKSMNQFAGKILQGL